MAVSIILHHYPQSPVAEKVRVVLGLKALAWNSVEIPRLPPKPDLMPLTGGYRRTPVLQIGAEIYCDSQCIIRELERRYPTPTLYPDRSAGISWAVSRWTDGPLFNLVLSAVLGAAADTLPEEFACDRGRLYFGPNYDLHALRDDLPHTLAQLRAQLGWIDERFNDGRAYMLGAQPGLPDVLCYYLIWFLRGRYERGPELLGQFENFSAWEGRIRRLGHGDLRALTPGEALAIARRCNPDVTESVDPLDPQQLRPGMRVTIVPEGDGGDPPVMGDIVRTAIDQVAIRRSDPQVGNVVVHFPRVGYRISVA
ncbi:MAG: glutathione S-transferase family protein [Gammaproteobacteria bacterium]|nr:glutathione S-transferase family protein [Gammaproteobacteria bacterium]